MPDRDEGPVTLASLRGGRLRATPQPAERPATGLNPRDKERSDGAVPQMGLLFAEAEQTEETKSEPAPRGLAEPRTQSAPVASAPVTSTARLVAEENRAARSPMESEPAMAAPWGRKAPVGKDVAGSGSAEKRVWTVRAIVADVRGRIDGGYGEVWVEGEISNCRPANSGHLYLTLKDGEAQLPVVLFRRHARLNLLVYPAVVQGPGAAASVMSGLRWFNRNPGKVELVVVARGGGAPEDLAGFNDERLARAIAASVLPVISAVGHETDFTIADFVADLRAPTPSAAAEIMTQWQHRIEERLAGLERRLQRASRYRLLEARQRFARTSAEHVLRRVQQGLDRRQQRVDDLERRMRQAMDRVGAARARRLEMLRGRLERQNVATRLIRGADRLARLEARLHGAGARGVARRSASLERVAARLEALSPVAVLARGYALLYNVEGMSGETQGLITSATDTSPGRRIRARLALGSLVADVTETEQG